MSLEYTGRKLECNPDYGINTIRAYSMTKQGRDQDPDGDYIRKWVPELSMVPTKYIHEPWNMPIELQETIFVLLDNTILRRLWTS